MAIVVETGAGLPDATSFASLVDGDAYHAGHLYAAAWTATEAARKEAALVMATRLLDRLPAWSGVKASSTQALAWPRYGVSDPSGYLIGSDVVPRWLKEATAELARLLLQEDITAESDTKGIRRLKVDVIELEFDPKDRKAVIPAIVRQMLQPYVSGFAGGATYSAQVLRS